MQWGGREGSWRTCAAHCVERDRSHYCNMMVDQIGDCLWWSRRRDQQGSCAASGGVVLPLHGRQLQG